MRYLNTLLLLVSFTLSLPAAQAQAKQIEKQAQPLGVVEGLQMPVWVQRGKQQQALRHDTVLHSGDRILTGGTGKVLLRLAEGSHIKLGVNSEFAIGNARQRTVFQGVFNVLKGAFRFTTTLLGKQKKRDIRIRVGTATAGIRGTDIWGRATAEQDLVCLIEGKIAIQRGTEAALDMSEPLSVYTAKRNAPADPLSNIDAKTLALWAQETELDAGYGVLSADGRYAVALARINNKLEAQQRVQQLQQDGYAATLSRLLKRKPGSNDNKVYQLVIEGFASRKDAKRFMRYARQSLGYPKATMYKIKANS